MKIAATLVALSAVTLIWAAPAQDPLSPVPEPLAPVPSADDFDVAHWAAALRNTDLTLRQQAYDRVLAEAGRREAVYEIVTAYPHLETGFRREGVTRLLVHGATPGQ